MNTAEHSAATAAPHRPSPLRNDALSPCVVVIPTYNERDNIGPLVQEVVHHLRGKIVFDIICVDDRSEDDTREVLAWLKIEVPELLGTGGPQNVEAGEVAATSAAPAAVLIRGGDGHAPTVCGRRDTAGTRLAGAHPRRYPEMSRP